MADKFTKITIDSDDGDTTPIGINGEVRRIANRRETVVNAEQLEALENSGRTITVIGTATKAEAEKAGVNTAGLVDQKDATYEQPPGGDYLPKPAPEEELDVRASAAGKLGGEPYTQPRGGDYLLKTPDTPLSPTDEDREAAIEKRDAFEAGDIEPVVELTNADPHQTKLQSAGGPIGDSDTDERGSGAGEATDFNAGQFLDRTLGDIRNELEGLSSEQYRMLLVEERGGSKRSTLMADLKKRLG